MDIIIPLAGKGSRFNGSKFGNAKPLIDIFGKPMVVRALETLGLVGKFHVVVGESEWKADLVQVLKRLDLDINIIQIDFDTKGPCSSALLAESSIDPKNELIIANCDQIMKWNSGAFLHNARFYDGLIVTYFSEVEHNSYAEVSEDGYVTKVTEKERISNISLNGIHYWKESAKFFDDAKSMIAANDIAPDGEFYIAPTFNYMIKKGFKVGIHHIPDQMHHAVGIPDDLEKFLKNEYL